MGALKTTSLGNSRVTVKTGFEFLLKHPFFLAALDVVKKLTPVSVPLLLKVGDETFFFHVRRTRSDHFSFLHSAYSKGLCFPEPVLNVVDPETKRFYLVTTHGPVKSVVDFIADPRASNKRKLGVLKRIAFELIKLNKAGLRHGDVVQSNVFVNKGDLVLLTNPELDQEVVEHIQGDLAQYRELLFHLEKELDHEPAGLWQEVKTDNFFKSLK